MQPVLDRRTKVRITATVAAFVLLVLAVFFLTRDDSKVAGGSASSAPPAPEFTKYTVKRGDFLIAIAVKSGIAWEELMLFNENALRANAAAHCAKARTNAYYCNPRLTLNGQPIMFANSLKAGDVLRIPKISATPAAVSQAVANIPGNRIVVVIDDTGSMSNDQQVVAAWYMQTIRERGKEVAKVLLYADGNVREYEAGGTPVFAMIGGFENTRGAIEHARTFSPDAIVLISDEPGDDWQDFEGMEDVPPIIAHSLDSSADANLSRAAKVTGGQFLRNYGGAVANSR